MTEWKKSTSIYWILATGTRTATLPTRKTKMSIGDESAELEPPGSSDIHWLGTRIECWREMEDLAIEKSRSISAYTKASLDPKSTNHWGSLRNQIDVRAMADNNSSRQKYTSIWWYHSVMGSAHLQALPHQAIIDSTVDLRDKLSKQETWPKIAWKYSLDRRPHSSSLKLKSPLEATKVLTIMSIQGPEQQGYGKEARPLRDIEACHSSGDDHQLTVKKKNE